MKEFVKTKKVTYNLMSFTAFKALVLFTKLTEGPKSYREICELFYNHPYLREQISIDTFRVYMNSLKRLGCEIKRFRGEDKESRYVITSHPFELQFSQEQLQSALKVFKALVKNVDIEELIYLESFFEKIGGYIKNEDFINEAKKLSMLKDIDKNILKELLECCKNKNQIVILYNSPNSGEKTIELIADKVEISNGKIYLMGTGFEYMQYSSFLVSRILQINEIKFAKTMPENLKEFKIIYEVYQNELELEDYEKILEKTDEKFIVEATVTNTFALKQRLLALGPNCKILEPENIKNRFVQLLKDMKAGYYCD